MTSETDDWRILNTRKLYPPSTVHAKYPLNDNSITTVRKARDAIEHVLDKSDDRLLVIIGPCSIHDVKAAKQYAKGLMELKNKLEQDLVIIMRVYFEKPRTTVGWKGLINDPDLNSSFNINEGLCKARGLLRDLNEMGMPAATECLDLITPQYFLDLISWAAIGARTVESQGHRELASGLSCPVGMKNGTDGTLSVAIDAIAAASKPHHFLSVTKEGFTAIFETSGNQFCHVILRGGNGQPNYDKQHVDEACSALNNKGSDQRLMIDFSHANSHKKAKNQLLVAQDVCQQISAGDQRIIGVMIESHLVEGNQNATGKTLGELTYGQSITDECISWQDSVPVLEALAAAVRQRRQQ